MGDGNKTPGGRAARTERLAKMAQQRAEQERRDRRSKLLFRGALAGLLALLVGGGIWLAVAKNNSTNTASSGSASDLAPVWSGLTGQSVDGVSANQSEQVAYHIHAHLAIYVDGTAKTVPYGIGIAQPWSTVQTADGPFVNSGSAFYYLHTHDGTGVIHIESPTTTQYTLGQFFAEWNQPLSATQVGSHSGAVIAYVNGAKFAGDPASIPLTKHALIQLDLGKDIAPQSYTFANGL